MLGHDKITDLYNKSFEMDCRSIQLVNSETGQLLVDGSGLVKQIDSKFTFKIFIKEGLPRDIQNSFVDDLGFSFKIIDFTEREWNFTTFLVNFNYQGVITGSFKKLECITSTEFDIPNYIRLSLFDIKDFPFTSSERVEVKKGDHLSQLRYLPISKYEDEFIKIEAKNEYDILTLDVFSNKIIQKDNFNIRIIEALQFILGKKIQPAIIQVKKGKQIQITISSNGHRKDVCIQSPIKLSEYNYPNSMKSWELFSKYIEFVIDFDEKVYHPLGANINSVVSSGNSFFETQILVLSIVIESILEEIYSGFAEPDNEFLLKVDNLLEYLENSKVDEKLRVRTKSTIGNMKRARAKDKLLKLIEENIITKQHYKDWDELRNSSAHGGMNISLEEESKFKEYLNKYESVMDLFYKLIFNKIGFNTEILLK